MAPAIITASAAFALVSVPGGRKRSLVVANAAANDRASVAQLATTKKKK